MPKIQRDDFLRMLEAVEPGLPLKGGSLIEQGDCIVLQNGVAQTFNEELCATARNVLRGIEGALRAKPVLALLRKISDPELDVSVKKGGLFISAKRKTCKFRLQAEVHLPVSQVEKPGKFHPLPEGFSEALNLVRECASVDENEFLFTLIHIHPDYLEASDSIQFFRYLLKTGLEEPILIKHTSAKHIAQMGMTEFSETQNWLHFRNSLGTILSCRRYSENYPDLEGFLDEEGEPAQLPKGILGAVERASVVTGEDRDNNVVCISLRPGELKISGDGVDATYEEWGPIKYQGPEFSFLITPKLISEIVTRHRSCRLNPQKILVDGENWNYVASLSSPKDDSTEEVSEEELEEAGVEE